MSYMMMELGPIAATSLESQDGTHASLKFPAFENCPRQDLADKLPQQH